MENKNIAVIQARMGSTRFPGKSIATIAGKPLIWHIIYRLRKSRKLSKIYLATSVANENDVLEKYVASLGVEVIRGSEENVFSRFESIFKVTNPETITRVCGDCPLIDATFIDRVLDIIQEEGVDYVKSDIPKSINQGVDIVSKRLFNQLLPYKDDPIIKEHVFSFSHLKLNQIKIGITRLSGFEYDSNIRLSVDTKSDLTFIQTLYKECNALAGTLSLKEIVKKTKENPSLKTINSHVHQKAPEQKTKKVFFLYNKKSNSSMLKLARKYVESEGMGVRFLVKKNEILDEKIDNNGFGVLRYSTKSELSKIIESSSIDFLIAEDLEEKFVFEMGLRSHIFLKGNLKKYGYNDLSTTR